MTLAAPEPKDHRAAVRHRALMAGRIRYGGGSVTVECVVRNISRTGAKIDVSEGVSLPSTFELLIPQKNIVHICELRWRRAGEAGVAFLDTETDAAEPLAPAPIARASALATPTEEALKARIRHLEAEIARLQARIVDLGGA